VDLRNHLFTLLLRLLADFTAGKAFGKEVEKLKCGTKKPGKYF
jgi:hypothetical protein